MGTGSEIIILENKLVIDKKKCDGHVKKKSIPCRMDAKSATHHGHHSQKEKLEFNRPTCLQLLEDLSQTGSRQQFK